MINARIDCRQRHGYPRSSGAAAGFSLIEVAVVFFIVTLLIGSFLVPLVTQVEQRQISETEKTLKEIQDTLFGFAVANGYLPCPDRTSGGAGGTNDTANDGVEDVNTGTGICNNVSGAPQRVVGNLPWVTLSLGASDVWGNRFRYAVTAAYAQRSPAALFSLSTPAILTVSATSGGTLLTGANPEGAVAVILSYGKNGYGAMNALTNAARPAPTSADELDNTGSTLSYTSRTITPAGTPAGEFDDIVTWIGKYPLFNRMTAAGKLP